MPDSYPSQGNGGESTESPDFPLTSRSGRRMKRGKGAGPFTEPALLAGLSVLLPMLDLLRQYSANELRQMVEQTFQCLFAPPSTDLDEADDR